MAQRTAVIIPALNEAGNIAGLVREVLAQAQVDWVVVADNGSSDDTAALAEEAGARVVQESRRGYGYACQAGTDAALRLGANILVYMDGDYSSRPAELSRLVEPLQENRADLALGSRTLGQIANRAMPLHQRFGNWLSSWLLSVLYRVRVTDLGPFRAIRADLLSALEMSEMTYGWPTEMIVRSVRRGGRVLEVPVTWEPRRSGRSKVGGTLKGSFLAAYHILSVTLRNVRF